MVNRVYAKISLENLTHNYRLLKRNLGNIPLMAVVKANAYGHGALPVTKKLASLGITHFGVASFKEAKALIDAGIKGSFLVFGITDPYYREVLTEEGMIQTVDSYAYASKLKPKEGTIDVHVKLDTGMSRFGIYCHSDKDIDNTVTEILKIASLDHIHIDGIYTHFAAAEADRPFTEKQHRLFLEVIDRLKTMEVVIPWKHAANSAAILNADLSGINMARSGIALYGYPPVDVYGFLPVMSLYAKIVSIRTLKKGDTVSYSRIFTAPDVMKIATIAIGYEDGYLRLNTSRDYVIYKNTKCRVLGKICMDACMIDVTDVPSKVGDFVCVMCEQKDARVLAKNQQTITYEVLTNIGNRVERVYDDET